MAVSNLLKRKINFRLTHEENHYSSKELIYKSVLINKLNIDDQMWLYRNSILPFIVHVISSLVTEEIEDIDYIYVFAIWESSDERGLGAVIMILRNPKVGIQQFPSNTNMLVCSSFCPAMNESYKIEVEFTIRKPPIIPDGWQEESDEEEPYTPPIKPYREDCCMACLESKPNILYLDCLHIAICDSCDRLKKTSRKNCDMCRSEISRRIAL